MTETNLNIVLTNALCCSGELALKISDMYSIGNKCADSEFKKLKILIDKLKVLEEYYCSVSQKIEKHFKNQDLTIPCFGCCNAPEGFAWQGGVLGCESFAYISGNSIVFATTDGGANAYMDLQVNAIPVGSIIIPNNCFEVSFDVIGDNSNPLIHSTYLNTNGNQSLQVYLGNTNTTIEVFSYLTNKTIKFCPTLGTSLSFNGFTDSFITISNIKIKQVLNDQTIELNQKCLDINQLDVLIHDIMKECNICDCQLNQDN